MGILSDRLPDSVTVEGMRIPLETDFRRWILFTELMTDERADSLTRIRCAAEIACRKPEELPEEMSGAFAEEFLRQLAAFALMSEAPDLSAETEEGRSAAEPEPAFDFETDGERICAAFLQCYGVDLLDREKPMHWWKFLTLLRHLPEDCEFMRVVQVRRADLSRIGDDGMRRLMRRAKAAVRIRRDLPGKTPGRLPGNLPGNLPESRRSGDPALSKGVISHG